MDKLASPSHPMKHDPALLKHGTLRDSWGKLAI
jgi:hypothetical protein